MGLKQGDAKRVYDTIVFTPQTAGATLLVPALEVLGYASGEIQLNGGTTAVVTISVSNDNINYTAIAMYDPTTPTPNTRVATATAQQIYRFALCYPWLKVTLTSITSGTQAGSLVLSSEVYAS